MPTAQAQGGLAQLGDLTFRINPQNVSWNFQVFTNVIYTLGGRVVQITGAQLSDITVQGQFGEDHQASYVWFQKDRSHTDGEKAPGRSWRLAEDFATEINRLMNLTVPVSGMQTNSSTAYTRPRPIRFYYPPRKWDFMVYIRSVTDDRGTNVVAHQAGKFSYGYTLQLVPVGDNTLHLAGDDSFALQDMKNSAIEKAFANINNGIGWHLTQFNDPNTGLPQDAAAVNGTKSDVGTPVSAATARGGGTQRVGQQ